MRKNPQTGELSGYSRLATSSTGKKALVVIDAGIATEENLKLIKGKGYDYLCVSRSKQ